jgi:hypothetical protein
MASNVKLSVAARNAFANAIADRVDSGAGAGVMEIRTGSPPANVSDASSGDLLAQPVFSDPAYADASSGTAASRPISDAAVLAEGDAGYFRVYADGAADTAAEIQGTAGETTDAPDLPFDEKTFSLGGKVCIRSVNIVISGGAPTPPPSEGDLIAESDIAYLGSFRMPSGPLPDSGVYNSTYGSQCPLAFRGKGGVARLISSIARGVSGDYTQGGQRLYEVTVPTLSTTPPYNLASVEYEWNDVWSGKKYQSDSNTTELRDNIWNNGLFCDPGNWDNLYTFYLQFYGATGSSPRIVKSTLDDATETGTGVACWSVDGPVDFRTAGGGFRIPSAFAAANCPGKEFAVGFGGAWMSTVDAASFGPTLYAVPFPDSLVTYPDRSSLPVARMMEFPGDDPMPPNRARRDDDYEDCPYGLVEAATSNTITFQAGEVYETGAYAGHEVGIYAGTASGQTGRTLTWISGRQYSVSPSWGVTPAVGDKYEIYTDYGGAASEQPVDGVGFWTVGESSRQPMVWVTGSKKGILGLFSFLTNHLYYGPGGIRQEGPYRQEMWVFDEDDFAASIAGDIEPYEVAPSATWSFVLPLNAFGGASYFYNTAIDQENRVLYVIDPNGWWPGYPALAVENVNAVYPAVHVYSIAGEN